MKFPWPVYVMVAGVLLQLLVFFLCWNHIIPKAEIGLAIEAVLLGVGLTAMNASRPSYFSVEMRYILMTVVIICSTLVLFSYQRPLP